MKLKQYVLMLAALLAFSLVNAQAQLGVSLDLMPLTGVIGDTAVDSGTIYIHNYGNQVFSDSVYLDYRIGGITYASTNFGTGIYFADTVNVAPGDSDKKFILIQFTHSVFDLIGTSGVVIWPRCPQSVVLLPPDSTLWYPDLTYPVGIAQTESEEMLLYMDGSRLTIKTNTENLVKRVRIYDVNGQLMQVQNISASSVIDMNNYASGMYIAQVTFVDDSQKAFKIVNIATR